MSGIAGSELLVLAVIGLLILGPEKLPRVVTKLGHWVGKARQMTRTLQRQFEEETSAKKNFGFDPKDLDPTNMMTPRDDDTYSPLHDEEDEDEDENDDASPEETETEEAESTEPASKEPGPKESST